MPKFTPRYERKLMRRMEAECNRKYQPRELTEEENIQTQKHSWGTP